MTYTLDDLSGYWDEALEAVATRDTLKLHRALMHGRAITMDLINGQDIWFKAKELYEQGMTPKSIAQQLGLIATQVKRRAYNQQWQNDLRQTRTLLRAKKKNPKSKTSQDFKKTCQRCHHDFRAKSGKTAHCSRCEMDLIKEAVNKEPDGLIAKSWESWGTGAHIV